MSVLTDTYVERKSEFELASAARSKIIRLISEVTKAMNQSADTFHFANCQGGFPAEVVLNRKAVTFDAREWPAAQQIQDVFVRWHEAKAAVERAWSALTEKEKAAMQPPQPFYSPQGRF